MVASSVLAAGAEPTVPEESAERVSQTSQGFTQLPNDKAGLVFGREVWDVHPLALVFRRGLRGMGHGTRGDLVGKIPAICLSPKR